MTQHKSRTVHLAQHIGDGERLAGAGHAEQSLCLVPVVEPFHQFLDGFRLVS